MPIHSTWRPASAEHVRLNVPHEAGVYELKSFGNLVYVGQADDLRAALLDHLEERSPNYYRVETPELLESVEDLYDRHLHRYEREHGGLPAWNESEQRAGDSVGMDGDESDGEANGGMEDEEKDAEEEKDEADEVDESESDGETEGEAEAEATTADETE